jgi:hypothetical protein
MTLLRSLQIFNELFPFEANTNQKVLRRPSSQKNLTAATVLGSSSYRLRQFN